MDWHCMRIKRFARSGKVAKGYPLASNKVNLRIMLDWVFFLCKHSKFKSVPLKKAPWVLGNLSNTLTLWDSWFCLWTVSLSLTITKILIRLQQIEVLFCSLNSVIWHLVTPMHRWLDLIIKLYWTSTSSGQAFTWPAQSTGNCMS